MKHLIAAAAMLAACAAMADYVARHDKDYVRITEAPCPESIPMPADWPRDMAHAAVANINGHDFKACWVLRSDGLVLLSYSDGDLGAVRLSDFKEDAGI
jgi:hypothetical protein